VKQKRQNQLLSAESVEEEQSVAQPSPVVQQSTINEEGVNQNLQRPKREATNQNVPSAGEITDQMMADAINEALLKNLSADDADELQD